VRTDHHVQVVALEECVEVIRAEVYYVVLLLRVTIEVVSETIFFLGFVRIAPKKIDYFLLIFRIVTSEFDIKRSWNLFNSFNILNSWSNTSMTTEYSLLLIRYN